MMEQLKNFFQDKSVRTILDVGTGTGIFIPVLQSALPGAKITGIDPNKESLAEATALYSEVTFVEMAGEKLDFDSQSFDVASISMALHHLPNVQQTLNEMKSVVKTGGWIIVNELFSDNLTPAMEVQKQMHHFRSKIDRLTGVCHNETFTRAEILEAVTNAGLNIQLDFDQNKDRKEPSPEEIRERINNLYEMLELVKDKPQYQHLKDELPKIETELKVNGFQMPTRVVVVAQISN